MSGLIRIWLRLSLNIKEFPVLGNKRLTHVLGIIPSRITRAKFTKWPYIYITDLHQKTVLEFHVKEIIVCIKCDLLDRMLIITINNNIMTKTNMVCNESVLISVVY